jgi:hypothetical protein
VKGNNASKCMMCCSYDSYFTITVIRHTKQTNNREAKVSVRYVAEGASYGVVFIPNFMMIGLDIQVMLRFSTSTI